MEQFTWLQIIGTLLGGGAVGTVLIPLLNIIKAAVKERRDNRLAAQAAHQSQATEVKRLEAASAVENRRLDAEEDERNRVRAEEILKFYQDSWTDCQRQLKELQKGDSLSHTIITKFFIALRSLRTQIDIFESMILRDADKEKLLAQVEILKAKWDAVNEVLPL